MYKAVTRDIHVSVESRFVEEESQPSEGKFFFAYTVAIANAGASRVRLRARYWKIIDGQGRMQEVRGAGVVGKEPVLGPGETFTYTSGCPLTTPDGTMEGAYTMETEIGEAFQVQIPTFALESPHVQRRVMH